MPLPHNQKNIVYGSITAGGDVRIGDEINYITYSIERDFKAGSILFLRLDKKKDTQLSGKSKYNRRAIVLIDNANDLDQYRNWYDTSKRKSLCC